jgi:hypothetical protein
MSFIILTVLPKIYGAPSPILGPITNSVYAQNTFPFAIPGYLQFNHTFSAIGSLFTDCVSRGACNTPKDSLIINIIWIILFCVTFPGVLIETGSLHRFITSVLRIPARIAILIRQVFKKRDHSGTVFILAAVSCAIINLVPLFALDQRLYYSIPVLIFLWVTIENNKNARFYCLLSMIFLLIKGWWIFTDILPGGFNIFEIRGMDVFVVAHYFFLMKSALVFWTETSNNPVSSL